MNEKEMREEYKRIFKQCLDDADKLLEEFGYTELPTDTFVRVASALFKMRASPAFYMRDKQ